MRLFDHAPIRGYAREKKAKDSNFEQRYVHLCSDVLHTRAHKGEGGRYKGLSYRSKIVSRDEVWSERPVPLHVVSEHLRKELGQTEVQSYEINQHNLCTQNAGIEMPTKATRHQVSIKSDFYVSDSRK